MKMRVNYVSISSMSILLLLVVLRIPSPPLPLLPPLLHILLILSLIYFIFTLLSRAADPVLFRYQIGGVKQRLQEQYEREPFQTPEYEYDFYCHDEAHSMAKSTEKKMLPPSNSHIYFSSPDPVTSPCKMASLCEDADEIEVEGQAEIDEISEEMSTEIIKNSHIFFQSAAPTPVTTPVKSASPWEHAMDVDVSQLSETVPVNGDVMSVEAVEAVEGVTVAEVVEEAVEEAVEILVVCPTTPSKALFKSAFGVMKSAKKSPFVSSAKKTPVAKQTPAKAQTPAKQTSNIASKTPITPVAAPVVATECDVETVEIDVIEEILVIESVSVPSAVESDLTAAIQMEVEADMPEAPIDESAVVDTMIIIESVQLAVAEMPAVEVTAPVRNLSPTINTHAHTLSVTVPYISLS